MTEETKTLALAGTVSGFRVMVDGTVRVTLDFEPNDREAAMRMMGAPGQPVAVAALKEGYAAAAAPRKEPIGPLCQTAIGLCRNPKFQEYIGHDGDAGFIWKPTEEAARDFILAKCLVNSRKDIDHEPGASERFRQMLQQFHAWSRANR